MSRDVRKEPASTKETKSSAKSDEILQSLVSLKCPYFAGDITAVLKPGAARNRILWWCIEVMHPNLVEYSKADITKLTKVLAALGLCREDDVGLVQGTTHKKQSEFLVTLFHLTSTAIPNMDEEVSRACEAVNHICLRGDLNEILPSSISLIPPTLQHAVKATGHKQKAPTLVQLERQQTALVQQLQEMQEKLDNSFSQDNLQAVTIKSKSFPVVLGTLEQQLTAYSHAFEQEFRPYMTSVPLALNDVGITSKRLQEQMTSLKTTLGHLKHLEESAKREVLRHQ